MDEGIRLVMVRAAWGAFIAISIGACSSNETLAPRKSDAGTDAPTGTGGHESGTGPSTGGATPVEARAPDPGPTGPHCEYAEGDFIRIPVCEGFDGGVPRLKGVSCRISSSYSQECPNFLVADTLLTGCCPVSGFTDCGLSVVRSDGRSYCGTFFPRGYPDPQCGRIQWGSEMLEGCRTVPNNYCGMKLVANVGGVVLDFGCVPSNNLPYVLDLG